MTNSTWSPSLCADAGYMKMRLDRIALAAPPVEAEQLRKFCASVAK